MQGDRRRKPDHQCLMPKKKRRGGVKLLPGSDRGGEQHPPPQRVRMRSKLKKEGKEHGMTGTRGEKMLTAC